MNFNRYSYITAVAGAFALFSACSSVKTTTATKAGDKVIFFDDFSAGQLDRTKWNVETTGIHVNDELQAYIDSSSTIFIDHGAAGADNGALVLQPLSRPGFVTRDGQHFDFISGRINTQNKFEFTYGTAEARIKMTAGAGLWPAWWLLGGGHWPETGEVDIMEFIGEKDWAGAAVHGEGYSGETPFVNRQYFSPDNDVTQWHTYAVDWTPDALLFKYDGAVMFRVTKTMAEHYGKWSFSNKKYLILNFAVGGIYPFKINGVKAPYYGLPASTLELIKNKESKMMVDWVRVTKSE